MKSVVLDGYAVNPGDLSWNFLSKYGEYIVYDYCSDEEIAAKIGDADIVLTNRKHIGETVIQSCRNIKYITALGTGYDMFDVGKCRENGIEVCNVPGYSTMSVAQHAFTLLITLVTDIRAFDEASHSGKWTGTLDFDYTSLKYTELAGKTIGIYGCGTIGAQLGRICKAFGMKVLGYRRNKPDVYEDGIEYVSKEELLSRSEFISFHTPLNDSTRGMVNREFISLMRDGVYVINTSRGAVIDEEAFAEALNSGKIRAAGIDVMAHEPPDAGNPLLKCRNCIITPHCAWVSFDARMRLMKILEANIDSFVENGYGINRVF